MPMRFKINDLVRIVDVSGWSKIAQNRRLNKIGRILGGCPDRRSSDGWTYTVEIDSVSETVIAFGHRLVRATPCPMTKEN